MEVFLKDGLAAGLAKPGEDSGPVDGQRLRIFADKHRLKAKRHEDNTMIIEGRVGDIWEYGTIRLAVTLLDLTVRKWNSRRKGGLGAGMELHQDGDFEGTLLFHSEDAEQVRVALKVAEVKKTRWMSPEAKKRLVEYGKATQFKSVRR